MANQLKIDVALPSKSKLQAELDLLLGKISSENIKVNFKVDGSSIKGILTELEKAKKQIGDFKILETGDSFVDGKMTKEFIKLEDSVGNVIKLVEKQGQVFRENLTPVKKLSEEEEKYIEQIYKANDALDVKKMKLQSVVDGLYSRGNIPENELNNSGLNEMISGLNLGSSGVDFERINQALQKQLTLEKEIISTKKQEQKETANAIKQQLDLVDKVEKVKDKYNSQIDAIEKVNEAFLKSSKGSSLKTELENIRTEVNNLNPSNVNELNNHMSKLDATIKNTKTDISVMGKEWSLATNNANTFTGAIGEALKKVGIFNIGYDIINGIENQFKDGVQSVIEMDSALADLNKVVDLSKSELLEMRNASVSLGKELGRNAVDVASGMAEFGRQYKDLEKIKEMTEASIIGANVMDNVTSGEVAKGLTTVITSLKLESSEAINIINKLNEVQNNYRVESGDMLNALAEVGSTAKTSGVELNDLTGYITALTVATGKSGDEVGTAIRSIMARMYKVDSINALKKVNVQVKDAQGNFRDFTSIMNDLDKVWGNLTDTQKIQLAQTVGGIQRYNDFISIVDNLDTAMKASATASDSFGSATKENEIYLQSIEGRMASLTATSQGFWFNLINSDAIKSGVSLLDSFIGGLDKTQQTFGSTSTVIGITSSAFLMFTNNPLKQLVKGLVEGGEQADKFKVNFAKIKAEMANTSSVTGKTSVGIKALGSVLDIAKLKAIALTTATTILQATLSLGLGIAITSIISGFTKLVGSLANVGGKLKEFNEEYSNVGKDSGEFSYLLSKYSDLEEKLNTLKIGTMEYYETEKSLNDIQSTLVTSYKDKISMIESDTTAKELNIDATKRLNKEELILAQSNAKETLKKNNIIDISDVDKAIDKYKEAYDTLDSFNERDNTHLLSNLSDTMGLDVGFLETIKTGGDLLPILKDNAEETASQLEALYSATGTMSLTDSKWIPVHEKLGEVLGYTKDEIYKTQKEVEGLESSVGDDPLGGLTISAESAESAIKGLNDELSGLKNTNEIIRQAIEEFNIYGELTTETYDKILGSGNSQMIAGLSDANTFLETYNRLLEEGVSLEEQKRQSIVNNALELVNEGNAVSSLVDQNAQNYSIDSQNHANATESKIENSILFTNKVIDGTAEATTKLGKNYSIDQENFRGITQGKLGIADDFVNGAMGGIATFVTNAGANYVTDSSNFVDQVNVKIEAMRRLQQTLDTFASNKIEFGGGRGILKPTDTALKDMGIIINKTGGGSYVNASKGGGYVGGSANRVNSGVGHGANGSNSGTGSGSSSKDREKEIEDMETLTDRYMDLENAVKDYQNAIAINKIYQENASTKEKIALMEQEVELYKKQQEAIKNLNNEQKKEAEELRKYLSSNQYQFDSKGNIINANKLLDYRTDRANNELTGEYKGVYIDWVKKQKEYIDRYYELVKDKIPKAEEEFNSLSNTITSVNDSIKDMYQDQVNIVASQEKEIANVYKYHAEKKYEEKKKALEKELQLEEERINKLKDSLNKEKELYNKKKSEDDYNSSLAKERQKLAEIQAEIDRLSMSTDQKSQAMLKQLMDEYNSQQQVISDMIKDKVHQDTNDRFDQENELLDGQLESAQDKFDKMMEELDKNLEEFLKPENLNKLIQEGMVNGLLTIEGVTIDLQKAMNDMLKETEYGFINVTNQMSSWVNSLKEVKNLYGDIGGIMNGAGIDSSLRNVQSGRSGDITITGGDIIVQGNADATTINEIKDLMKKNNDEVYKNISKALNGK